MKVSHNPLPPVPASHGAERGHRAANTAGAASASGVAPAVEVSLSEEGQRISGQGGKPEAPGAHSVAHRARAMIGQYAELGEQPFGHLVSSLARGDFVAPVTTPPAEDETPPAEDATTDGIPAEGDAAEGTGEVPPADEAGETPGPVGEGETTGEDTVSGAPEESETVAGDDEGTGSGEQSTDIIPDPSIDGTDTLLGELIESLGEASEGDA